MVLELLSCVTDLYFIEQCRCFEKITCEVRTLVLDGTRQGRPRKVPIKFACRTECVGLILSVVNYFISSTAFCKTTTDCQQELVIEHR